MNKLVQSESFWFWFVGAIPFAMIGWFGSLFYFLSWPVAVFMGYVNGYVLHKYPAGWAFTAHGWPLALTTIVSGLVIGGLPYWFIFAVALHRPLFILGDAVTAALYIAGIGLYIGKIKLQYWRTRHQPSSL